MARYRVGNTYLSEGEYNQHLDENALTIVFLGGVLLGGVGMYYICPSEWPKVIRLGLIVATALFVGYLAAWLKNILLWLIFTSTVTFAGYKVLEFLWSLL